MDLPADTSSELSQPTRARIFALLGELRRGAGTDEIAERLGLHPNGVRLHLERLHTAGLVERRRERQARGRPRDIWLVDATALPGGDPPTSYADLGRWLVRAIIASGVNEDEVEAAGRRIGQELAPANATGDTFDQVLDAFTALGFQPEREDQAPGEVKICLQNCPYRDVVRVNQPLVCSLHRGIAGGLLETVNPEAELKSFVPKDPDLAGCHMEMTEPADDTTAE